MKIAFLTSGGIAPCLSASIGSLIENYQKSGLDLEYIGYQHGYYGLLKGKSILLNFQTSQELDNLKTFGGTILGNSRVKLTNVDDCVKNGYIQEGEDPLEVAANQLLKDDVNILQTMIDNSILTINMDIDNGL